MRIVVWKRVLLVATVASWVSAGAGLAAVIQHDTRLALGWLMVALAVSGALTGASLIVAVLGPVAQVYRAGYDAGLTVHKQETRQHGRRTTDLRVVPFPSVGIRHVSNGVDVNDN